MFPPFPLWQFRNRQNALLSGAERTDEQTPCSGILLCSPAPRSDPPPPPKAPPVSPPTLSVAPSSLPDASGENPPVAAESEPRGDVIRPPSLRYLRPCRLAHGDGKVFHETAKFASMCKAKAGSPRTKLPRKPNPTWTSVSEPRWKARRMRR